MTQPIHPMLERVARAIASRNHRNVDAFWFSYVEEARAAIQALLEPTDDMIEAAHNEPVPNHTTPLEDERICWRAAFRPLIGEGE